MCSRSYFHLVSGLFLLNWTSLFLNLKKIKLGFSAKPAILRMSSKHGAPKHQNKYAWKPNAGRKINETEVGGRFRPLSEITGVCLRCKDQIDWKRRYGKYKPLSEPAKWFVFLFIFFLSFFFLLVCLSL